MKNVFFILLLFIILGLLGLVFHVGQKLEKTNKTLEEERYSRMVAEETLQKDTGKLTILGTQLKETKSEMTSLQETLNQEKNANADLKKENDQLEQSKQQLEGALQTQQDQQTHKAPSGLPQDTQGK